MEKLDASSLAGPGQAQTQFVPQRFISDTHRKQQKVLLPSPGALCFHKLFPPIIHKVGSTSMVFQANPENTSDNLRRPTLNAEILHEISREISSRINL